VSDDAEPEKTDESVDAAVPAKEKFNKVKNNVRHRNRSKGADSVPKVILKRKKSTNYWLWAAAPAAVLVLLLLVFGYIYLL
jgi:predicted 2-oxoglutarate/Fe(II)-dependent dioxygenase YbiX